ncbi:MAG: DUF5665 domain-containing protein [Thermacetogeniaceae bacterium]
MERLQDELLTTLKEKIEELSLSIERMKLAEYVDLLNRPWRLLYINFISGLARGVGIAVGFSLLGALLIVILQRLVVLHLPLISDFIAQIIRLVQLQLRTGVS